ncbi:hypothetical protein HNQ71_006829 [Mesorhizobium sangaii]|uniref:Uncharacterized protein n=1 Tax=Mesorhizobium sangaii TaxID=505389 RepID=A0A841PU95_9HYPH|nr:hypothetical protein [Mesorhizobium sangaii]
MAARSRNRAAVARFSRPRRLRCLLSTGRSAQQMRAGGGCANAPKTCKASAGLQLFSETCRAGSCQQVLNPIANTRPPTLGVPCRGQNHGREGYSLRETTGAAGGAPQTLERIARQSSADISAKQISDDLSTSRQVATHMYWASPPLPSKTRVEMLAMACLRSRPLKRRKFPPSWLQRSIMP